MTKTEIAEIARVMQKFKNSSVSSKDSFFLKYTAKLMSWVITIFVLIMVAIAFIANGFWSNDRFLVALSDMKWVIITIYSTLELMLGGGMMVKKFVETKYSSDNNNSSDGSKSSD